MRLKKTQKLVFCLIFQSWPLNRNPQTYNVKNKSDEHLDPGGEVGLRLGHPDPSRVRVPGRAGQRALLEDHLHRLGQLLPARPDFGELLLPGQRGGRLLLQHKRAAAGPPADPHAGRPAGGDPAHDFGGVQRAGVLPLLVLHL